MYTGELITAGIGLLTTGASAWISYFFTRRKYLTEVDHSVIENLKESLKFYEELTAHNQEKLKELMGENKALRKELDEVRKQLQELTTNLYLDESFKNRVRTRQAQLRKQKSTTPDSERFNETQA